jgi:2-dehydro-3-deoxygluconokinase
MHVVVAGEGMLELSRDGSGWRLGHGGDTLNAAIHLARAGIATAYLTALGSDPFSAKLKASWQAEGLDCSLVLTHPDRQPGLYAISTDATGERQFTYWRSNSAAREMFALPGMAAALEWAAGAELFAFSLISLAILPLEGRDRLLGLAGTVRANGGRVAFDGNYRPALWSDAGEARHWRDAAIACADIGLPTQEDEAAMGGPVTAAEVAAHWQALGCGEVVVKLGGSGCRLPDGSIQPPPRTIRPVDTSGAGDAFNAGYITGRLGGLSPARAALAGQRLAGCVIMRRGAIPKVPEWPALLEETI